MQLVNCDVKVLRAHVILSLRAGNKVFISLSAEWSARLAHDEALFIDFRQQEREKGPTQTGMMHNRDDTQSARSKHKGKERKTKKTEKEREEKRELERNTRRTWMGKAKRMKKER